MYYQLLKDGLKQISFDEINNSNITVCYISFQEFKNIYQKLNIDDQIIFECNNNNKNLRNTFETYDNYSFGILNIRNIKDITKEYGRIGFFLMNNLLCIILLNEENNMITNNINDILNKITINYTFERIISTILEQLISGSFDTLEYFEKKIINIEKEVFKKEINKNLNIVIFSIKKELTIYKRYFEYILNFINNLKADENDIFNNTNLRYINNLEDKLIRLSNNTQYLIESTIHLRETYQSAIDYYQNKTIKLLTIITSIFMPLTLITGWYGMNFVYMPEIYFKYSYPCIILLAILIIIICIIFFKKRKIL